MAQSKPRVQFTCNNCGSPNVTQDAVVRFDAKSQEWEVSSIFDNADCDVCGGETNISSEPLSTFTGDKPDREQMPQHPFDVGAIVHKDHFRAAIWRRDDPVGSEPLALAPANLTLCDEVKDTARSAVMHEEGWFTHALKSAAPGSRFEVTVPATFVFEVTTTDEEEARREARDFIQATMTADHNTVDGYNGARKANGLKQCLAPSEIAPSVDYGLINVEDAEDE